MDWDVSIIEKLDELIKSGQGEQVRTQLQSIRPVDVPRIQRAPLAKIALRVGDTNFALALLRPLAQSETPLVPPMNSDEFVQYGMCLKQVGASDHALKVFSQVSAQENPEVLLYESITLFTQWRYAEAIPKLQAYMASNKVSDYQKWIGALNLASAYIFEGHYDGANNLLQMLIKEAAEKKHHLIHGNSLELLSQVAIYQRDFSLAETYLSHAEQLIHQSSPIYKLFLEKWAAVLQLFKTKAALSSLKQLDAVREKALQLRHFETVRDCDFFFAVGKCNHHLFYRVYFGTPFPAYQARLQKHFPEKIPLPQHFDWRGNTAHLPIVGDLGVLDLRSQKSQLNLKLIKIIAADFYSPIKPFTLYLNLFPQEKLDPAAALPKVFTAVSRAKKWLETSEIPIDIERSENGYRLDWSAPFVLRVPLNSSSKSSSSSEVSYLQKAFGEQSFSSSDAAEILKAPQRTVVRLLQESVLNGTLVQTGQGRSTRYKVKKSA